MMPQRSGIGVFIRATITSKRLYTSRTGSMRSASMKTNYWFLIAAMAVLLAMTVSAADVAGKWVGQMPTRGGETRETTFNLKASGGKLTGTMTGPQGDVEIMDGKVSSNDISFKVSFEAGGNTIVILFNGVVSADEIRFTRKREGADQSQQFTAKRAS